jgi:hypothetical protein
MVASGYKKIQSLGTKHKKILTMRTWIQEIRTLAHRYISQGCQPKLEKNPLKTPDFRLKVPKSFLAENPLKFPKNCSFPDRAFVLLSFTRFKVPVF